MQAMPPTRPHFCSQSGHSNPIHNREALWPLLQADGPVVQKLWNQHQICSVAGPLRSHLSWAPSSSGAPVAWELHPVAAWSGTITVTGAPKIKRAERAHTRAPSTPRLGHGSTGWLKLVWETRFMKEYMNRWA